MKEMVYKAEWNHELDILDRGFYNGYEYLVVSVGVHPCAYVAIAKGQPYYECSDYDDFKINCHGGCTFIKWGYPNVFSHDLKVIGWDYGHCGDFSGFYKSRISKQFKKWTTAEIVEECKKVIDSLYVLEHGELFYA